MIEEKKYDAEFYDSQSKGSHDSAAVILPLVNEWIHPASVLDVGCGVGTWLKVWQYDLGVNDITGIDGDYVKRELLAIPAENFISKDLKSSFDLKRKFDLVMSLEVGEHLPTEKSKLFVENLTKHGDIILFSAALSEQHGTYHINEQLPEFWASIFTSLGYVAVDIVRDKIWNDNSVEWWYRQNIMMYVNKHVIDKYPVLAERARHTNPECLIRIHPLLWQYRNDEVKQRSHIVSFLRWKVSELKKNILGPK